MSRARRPILLGLLSLVLAPVTAAHAAATRPTVEGPITGPGTPFIGSTTSFDLAQVGYEEEEYFISGAATAYTTAAPLTSDGKWTVTPGPATAAYKTRLLVYRPINRRKFGGTVVVEWLNVSGGVDAAPDWTSAHTEIIRERMAWVGVSAQYVGVEGGTPLLGIISLPLKTINPARYGSLVHPGDSFSYDMFSQAGEAIRNPADVRPLGDLQVKKVIAVGDSQSAFRLVTYVNGIHPLAEVYDGFLVHSRGTGSAALSEAPQPVIGTPHPTLIRTDLHVPVMTFETETDILGLLGFYTDRQPDTDLFRLWEVAGTSHADAYSLVLGGADLGNSPAVADLVLISAPLPGLIECPLPINDGPMHFVLNGAVKAMNGWVRHGTPPPHARPIEVAPGPSPSIVRDEHGNALGGIRTPELDAPIATLSGLGQTGALTCLLFGTTTPFDAATLASLYPTHDAYVSAFDLATRRALRSRFLVAHDARLLRTSAAASTIGQ
jgi:hypothetical protein